MKSRIILIACICFVLAGSLPAADTFFTGAIDKLWTNPDNWSNGVPTDVDRARFRNNVHCILDATATCKQVQLIGEGSNSHLTLVDGANLTVGVNSGWVGCGWNVAGSADELNLIEVRGGIMNCEARFFVGNAGRGTLIIDYDSVININEQFLSLGQLDGGEGIVEIRGGAINLLSTYAEPLRFRTGGANSKASMDFSGGILTQPYTDLRAGVINDHIADGTITAYGGIGTVLVETNEDNIIVVEGLHPFNPTPKDGAQVVSGSRTLTWNVPSGTDVDVWFGTSPDLSAAEKIVKKEATTFAEVTLENKKRYYWAVDTYQEGVEEPNFGPIFDFYVDNLRPVVKAADEVTTWMTNGSVDTPISATVDDIDPTTTLWTVVTEPNEGTAIIANPAQLETTVTLMELGTYVLQIEANDGEYDAVPDRMTINVFADSCLAAQSLPGWTVLPGDVNLDCVVDQKDLDLLLEQWLNCNGQDCPDIDPIDPNVL